jgi:hypothetical protein
VAQPTILARRDQLSRDGIEITPEMMEAAIDFST